MTCGTQAAAGGARGARRTGRLVCPQPPISSDDGITRMAHMLQARSEMQEHSLHPPPPTPLPGRPTSFAAPPAATASPSCLASSSGCAVHQHQVSEMKLMSHPSLTPRRAGSGQRHQAPPRMPRSSLLSRPASRGVSLVLRFLRCFVVDLQDPPAPAPRLPPSRAPWRSAPLALPVPRPHRSVPAARPAGPLGAGAAARRCLAHPRRAAAASRPPLVGPSTTLHHAAAAPSSPAARRPRRPAAAVDGCGSSRGAGCFTAACSSCDVACAP